MKSQCRITLPILLLRLRRSYGFLISCCNQHWFAYLQVILLEDGSLHEVHVANGDGGEVDGVEGRRQRVHVGRHRVREEVEHGSERIEENFRSIPRKCLPVLSLKRLGGSASLIFILSFDGPANCMRSSTNDHWPQSPRTVL